MINIFNEDGLKGLNSCTAEMVFVDPPDNIGLGYGSYNDCMEPDAYAEWLNALLHCAIGCADKVWVSFNAKHTVLMGRLVYGMQTAHPSILCKPCVQTFTFGQHNKKMFGNNHRPLWLLYDEDATFYPDAVRVESWRQKNGDKRACPDGRVPSDVFDFPRVTGNSKQRRRWHPTQLHEGLVERCILFSTREGDTVVDPCAGTGTTGRVAERLGRDSILFETDNYYCDMMKGEYEKA